jgi:hypothetical protein
MNDDFLTRHRKSPPREFSEALYQRINLQMNAKRTPSLRWFPVAAALCIALLLALATSPSARAAISGLIVHIGGMILFEQDETASQATALPESQVTIVPQEILSLENAQAKLPYSIKLPAWVPDGFAMGSSVRIDYFPGAGPQVTITYYGSDPDVGNIDLTIYAQKIDWQVETEDIQEVDVNGQPAALVNGSWDIDSNRWNREAARMLNWMKGKEMYQLHSVGAAVEDLIRMAESIP